MKYLKTFEDYNPGTYEIYQDESINDLKRRLKDIENAKKEFEDIIPDELISDEKRVKIMIKNKEQWDKVKKYHTGDRS